MINKSSYFHRKTTSGKVIPQLDGLRALAILMVIFFHYHGFLSVKLPEYATQIPDFLRNIMRKGDHGVPLFFAISGFILSIPFAKELLHGGKKVKMGKYLLRRFTRLQPTYFIVLALFGAVYFFIEKYEASTLISSFVSSMFYLHNIIFDTGSLITYVAWSLEIELQFYLVLPLFAQLFRLPAISRRLIMLTIIISAPLIIPIINYNGLTLLSYYHYFFGGILIADLFLSGFKENIFTTGLLSKIIIISALFNLFGPFPAFGFSKFLYPVAAMALLYLSFTDKFLKGILSNNWVVLIGTISYTLYLIHFQLISLSGNILHTIFNHSSQPFLYTTLASLFSAILIIALSAIIFLFIEKPFMNPNWYK